MMCGVNDPGNKEIRQSGPHLPYLYRELDSREAWPYGIARQKIGSPAKVPARHSRQSVKGGDLKAASTQYRGQALPKSPLRHRQ
jgi:hypothetical protein